MKYHFPAAWEMYEQQRTPFMHMLFDDMQQRKPYRGLKILHNLPIMISDLLKIDCLLVSGADVTITMPKFVLSDPEAIQLVKRSPIHFIPTHAFSEQYDILLDCCAELAEVTTPSIGAVEITQTGANKYRNRNINYPVISIDDSKLKFLEDSIGSADGFMRAFDKLVTEDYRDKKYLVFGFGKVGVGIARELKKMTQDVIVVDQSEVAIKNALRLGYHALHTSEYELIMKEIQDAFCVVTATGNKGFISKSYEKKIFAGKVLVNIGAEDEFGELFEVKDVLNSKMPVNFVLKEPTKIEYLDPAYYAHNTCIDLLLNQNLNSGVHPLPSSMDEAILNQWFYFHNADRGQFDTSIRNQYEYT
jgi:adenosylhomocysteinase